MGAQRMSRGRHRVDGGASLVEFALILPVFVMLILGMFSGGIALNDKQQMTHAVREGARYGSTFPASGFSSNELAEAIRDQVYARSDGLLGPGDDVCVSVVRGTPDADAQETADGKPAGTYLDFEVVSTTDGVACDPNETYLRPTATGDTGQRIQVRASHPTEIELGLFGSFSITMDEAATAKSEYDS